MWNLEGMMWRLDGFVYSLLVLKFVPCYARVSWIKQVLNRTLYSAPKAKWAILVCFFTSPSLDAYFWGILSNPDIMKKKLIFWGGGGGEESFFPLKTTNPFSPSKKNWVPVIEFARPGQRSSGYLYNSASASPSTGKALMSNLLATSLIMLSCFFFFCPHCFSSTSFTPCLIHCNSVFILTARYS